MKYVYVNILQAHPELVAINTQYIHTYIEISSFFRSLAFPSFCIIAIISITLQSRSLKTVNGGKIRIIKHLSFLIRHLRSMIYFRL